MIKDSSSTGEVLIIGAGAIGGVTGAILHQSGIDVCLVNRKSPHFEKVKSDGLQIEGFNKKIKIPIFPSTKKIKKPYNHVIVSVKNTNTEEVMRNIQNILTEDSLVYSLQNGFGNTEIMGKYIPSDQIVAGVVGWGANKIAPGVIRVTSKTGNFVLGFEKQKSTNDPRLLEIKKFLSHWKSTKITDNILGYRWAKLIVNSVISSFGGLLGVTVGEMMDNPRINTLMGACKDEGILVADNLQIKLEKVDNMNIRNFFYQPKSNDSLFKRIGKSVLSAIINRVGAKRHNKIHPSLLWDLEHNRKTEVDFLNGYIVRKAEEYGLETPMNRFLVNAVHEIEDEKREIGLHNLSELKEIAALSREKVEDQKTN
jgi:2-dehydropantoate 2-reductase